MKFESMHAEGQAHARPLPDATLGKVVVVVVVFGLRIEVDVETDDMEIRKSKLHSLADSPVFDRVHWIDTYE